MSVRRVESRLPPGLAAADLGQATPEVLGPSGERFVLVSYLNSPVPERTRLDYVLFGLPPASANENLWLDYVKVDEYVWQVTSSTDSSFFMTDRTTNGVQSWTPERPGQYTIQVTPRLAATTLPTLQLTQTVVARNAQLEALLKGKKGAEPDSQRELINDLGDYVRAAAASTGPKGIPARLLAAILFMELNARPKEGTRRATMYRSRAHTFRNPTWAEWTLDEITPVLNKTIPEELRKRGLKIKPDFFPTTEIRCVENYLVGEMFDDEWAGRPGLFGAKSIGVGQIGLSTAAMVVDPSLWVDASPENKDEARSQMNSNWRVLSLMTKIGIFNRLRFPKSNIKLAADLLARLKNRANRLPNTLAGDLWKNAHAVGVLATEYNMGATTSALADAKLPKGVNENWVRAQKYVKRGDPIFPERFFP